MNGFVGEEFLAGEDGDDLRSRERKQGTGAPTDGSIWNVAVDSVLLAAQPARCGKRTMAYR